MSARAIGIGARTAATSEEIVAFVRATFGMPSPGTLLATVDRRSGVMADVARVLGAQLITFSPEELARVKNTTITSLRAAHAIGTPSVAEAAALAALGDGARLIVPRRSSGRCTCALAERT